MPIKNIPPEYAATVLAFVVAFIRIKHDQRETKIARVLLESALCGSLAMTAHHAIAAMGLSTDWSIFTGGVIGYLGSTAVRGFALRFINKKIGPK